MMREPQTEAGRVHVESWLDCGMDHTEAVLAIEDEARADERHIVAEESKPLVEAAMRMARDMARADLAARLRELHYPVTGMGWLPSGGYDRMDAVCASCGTSGEFGVVWPCPTAILAAIRKEAEG